MWNSLDFSDMRGTRILGIWDEFTAKLRIALSTETEYGAILNKFCTKFNVNLRKDDVFDEISSFSQSEQHELFEYIRENLQILIVELRLKKEKEKNEQKN